MVKSPGKHEVSTERPYYRHAGQGTGRKGTLGGRKPVQGLSKQEVKKAQREAGQRNRKRVIQVYSVVLLTPMHGTGISPLFTQRCESRRLTHKAAWHTHSH